MPRDLTKWEYGKLQDALAETMQMYGARPTKLAVSPHVMHIYGVNLSLFCMEHRLEIVVKRNLPPGLMVVVPPKPVLPGDEWKQAKP